MRGMVYDIVRIFLDPLNLVVGIVMALLTMMVLKRIYRGGSKKSDL